MVFVEFENHNGQNSLFFVGTTVKDILEDTNNGTNFGGLDLKFLGIRTEEYVRENGKSIYMEKGIKGITELGTKSFLL